MTLWWILFDSCFCAAINASVSTVLAFRRCVTHVDSAGRPNSLYSRVCSFLATRFYSYYLIFYYVWAEPRLIMLLSKTMGGGIVMPWSSPQHDCDAMLWYHDLRRSTIVMPCCDIMIFAAARLWCHVVIPWSSPQHKQFSSQLVFLVFVLNVCLCWRVLPAETGENSICPVFNFRVPPRVGANRRVCITAFWYLRWLKHLFDTFYFWERWRQMIGILCVFVAVATE